MGMIDEYQPDASMRWTTLVKLRKLKALAKSKREAKLRKISSPKLRALVRNAERRSVARIVDELMRKSVVHYYGGPAGGQMGLAALISDNPDG